MSGKPGGLPLSLACCHDSALVVEAAAPCQGQLHLRLAVFEVQLRRDEGERLLLGAAEEFVDFASMEEELAPTVWIVCPEPRCELPRRDVDPEQPHLAVGHPRVCVVELCTAAPERLHLAPLEH